MEIYTTKIFGENFSIRGNFAEASSPIEVLGDDGTWATTQWQVADFSHSVEDAMRTLLMEYLEISEYDSDMAAIEAACKKIQDGLPNESEPQYWRD